MLAVREIYGWTPDRLRREYNAGVDRIGAIREQAGGSLVNVKGADADEVRQLMGDLNVMGERLDELAHAARRSSGPFPLDSSPGATHPGDPLRRGGIGEWLAFEVGALTEGAGTGQYLVPPVHLPSVWDRLHAESVGLRSGFTVVETTSDELHIPTTVADGAASWTAEAAVITPTDPTFGEVIARPRKLAALVQMSNEIVADSNPSVLDVVTGNLFRALALKLDLGFYEGSGVAPEITGLKNTAGIQTVSMGANGGLVSNLDPFADAIAALEAENATATVIVMHPRTWKQIRKLKDADSRPLVGDGTSDAPRVIFGVPVLLTSQLSITETQGTATNASSAFVYEAGQILAVRRQEARIEVDRSRLFNSDQAEMRAILRFDMVVPNPKAVVRIQGITP